MNYRNLSLVCTFLAMPLLAGCGSNEVSTATVDVSQLPPQEQVHVMAAQGDLDGLQAALKQSPELANARSSRNRNLLHTAAENGQKDVVAFLLQNGMNPNEQDDQGAYPAELAGAEGHNDLAKMISEAAAGSPAN